MNTRLYLRRMRINSILARLSERIVKAFDAGEYPVVWIERAEKLAQAMKGQG